MNINDQIKMLIFSKNRAMQLDLCLNSFYFQSRQNSDLPEIDVIYKADSEHKESYNRFQYEHPYVNMIEEDNFRTQVIESLNKKYILFCVDDTIWCNPFDLNDPIGAMEIVEFLIGFSFRLGKNSVYCYPFRSKQMLPSMFSIGKNMFGFSWLNESMDFGYPLELSSSLYRTSDIIEILKDYHFKNPNELEVLLDYCKVGYFLNPDQHNYKPQLACYKQAVAFAAPMNRVQDVALSNRFNGNQEFHEYNLLKLYNDGFRIDYKKFDGIIPSGAHMEVEYEFYKEQE